jgi:DNA-directed RNA polymerase subunit alpha
MNGRKFEMPKKFEFEKETFSNTYGKFIAEPFERGYAQTIGNSLRRVLLSSIQGAAITRIKINGISHEFSTIPGVVEDVTQIILNLKEVKLKLLSGTNKKVYISVSGEREVKAGDIVIDEDIEIVNPDHHIATLSGRNSKLDMEMDVELGRGYVPAEKNKNDEAPDMIPIDAIFTPVTKVNFNVENTRVGHSMDYEKLILEIYTDGRIKPDDALSYAAQILRDHFTLFITLEEEVKYEKEELTPEFLKMKELLTKSIEEIELSVRSSNCLRTANIKLIGELVQHTEEDMLKYRNFGRKSLNEIKDILQSMGLSLGMKLDPKLIECIKEAREKLKLKK